MPLRNCCELAVARGLAFLLTVGSFERLQGLVARPAAAPAISSSVSSVNKVSLVSIAWYFATSPGRPSMTLRLWAGVFIDGSVYDGRDLEVCHMSESRGPAPAPVVEMPELPAPCRSAAATIALLQDEQPGGCGRTGGGSGGAG